MVAPAITSTMPEEVSPASPMKRDRTTSPTVTASPVRSPSGLRSMRTNMPITESEDEIVFKYYQFIDAQSEQEFDSYMNDMEGMSLYDTGVTAQYGDRLLTLSTCDYQEKNGRFVVVAKKVTAKE